MIHEVHEEARRGFDRMNVDLDARQRAKERLWKRFRELVAEVDQIEIDILAWNDMHPEARINPDVSLERKRLEENRRRLPK